MYDLREREARRLALGPGLGPGRTKRLISLSALVTALLLGVLCWGVVVADDEAIVAADGGLNLRSAPTVDAEPLALMPNGSRVMLRGPQSDGWYPVSFDGVTGWAAAAFLQRAENRLSVVPVTAAGTRQATVVTSLRLRAGPDATSAVLSTMPPGTRVDVDEANDGSDWWKVRLNGLSGYAFADYLSPADAQFDLDLPVPFRRQMTDVWCEAADLQMWAEYSGHRTGPDYQTQQELWDWELAHNMGYTVDQWNASPYAVASAAHYIMPELGFNHFRYDDPLEATRVMAWFIANPAYRQPSIALIWRGDHYVLVRGVRADSDPYANYPRAKILGVYVADPNKGSRSWLGEDRYIPIAEWLSSHFTAATYLTPHTGVPGDPWQGKYVAIQPDWDTTAPTEAGRTLAEFQAYALPR